MKFLFITVPVKFCIAESTKNQYVLVAFTQATDSKRSILATRTNSFSHIRAFSFLLPKILLKHSTFTTAEN